MVEVKNNKLMIDGSKTALDQINVIHQVGDNLHVSNSIVEFAKNVSIKDVYKQVSKANGNFMLINRAMVNLDNVESVGIKYYQYAGISIYECDKKNAELYTLSLQCANGKTEAISFKTLLEVQKAFRQLKLKLVELKNNENTCE